MVLISLFSSATDLTSEVGEGTFLQNRVVLKALEEMPGVHLNTRYKIVICRVYKLKQFGRQGEPRLALKLKGSRGR